MARFKDEADDYDLKLVRQTDLAWLVDTGQDQVWLPKSQCECGHPAEGKVCTFTVPNWLAEEKGLV